MSEQTEKQVHIIMPDLLNYLEMVESGEIIERRLKEKDQHFRKNDDRITHQLTKISPNIKKYN